MKFKKVISLLCAFAMVMPIGLAGCNPSDEDPANNEFSTDQKVTLNLAVMYDKNAYITYYHTDANVNEDPQGNAGYLAANGQRYIAGQDIKPVWQELATRLNFDIVDKGKETNGSNLTAQWNYYTTGQGQGFADVHMINTSGANIIEEALTNDRFEDITPYLEAGNMPNLKKFLEDNPFVASQIKAGNGATYYAPYFDGYDDIERMFMLRADWVEKLLDGDETAIGKRNFDTQAFTAEAYKPFMPATMSNKKFTIVKADGSGTQEITKSYTQNIITIQDELSTRNGESLAKALRDYIDTTYGSTFGTTRSKLFTGVNAAYDADELVALLRCVKANPMLLSGQGEMEKIVPFYPRANTADRTYDVLRLASIWGVRGLDTRTNWYYVDENGVLQDTRLQANTMDALERLNQLYKEGLILNNYINSGATSGTSFTGDGNHRGKLNYNNLGFMTYDYNQTTTVVNKLGDTNTSEGKDGDNGKYIEGFNLTPVIPPFTNWNSGTTKEAEYTRFTESWRSVKPDGWAVLKNAPKAVKERCLTLMDYMYSEAGNRLMSYGPEEWIDGTIEYNGRQVPKLSAAAQAELAHYASGNYTNYYRRYLGGTFPIGYIKEQGMEYQCTHEKGQKGLDNILKAIALGTMGHLNVVDPKSETDPRFMSSVPSMPLTTTQQTMLTDYTSNLNTYFATSSGGATLLFSYYVINGFENKASADGGGEVAYTGLTKTQLVETLKKGDGFALSMSLELYRVAYAKAINY